MAGDVNVAEQAIVATPEIEMSTSALADEVGKATGRVSHHYGPRVMIAEVPVEAESTIRSAVGAAEMNTDAGAVAAGDLDEAGAIGLAAFGLRQSAEFNQAKANRPLAGELWDNDSSDTPMCDRHGLDEGADVTGTLVAAAAQSATSGRLNGKIAVGIVIVSGPTADLQFSDAERQKVVAEVQNGLSWLGSQNSGGHVSWHYDIRPVSITTAPSGNSEALWRDPAMVALGFPGTWQGVYDYINSLKTSLNTDWTYCAFFTKYPVTHFAYASLGGPRLVMEYSNDRWGPDNIDRVFAHETGHIFEAPDEYAASGCDCGGQYGYFNQPNGNCANCAAGGGVNCIMRANEWAMCHYTTWHFGNRWPSAKVINTRDHTPVSPSAVEFNNQLYVFFKADDSGNRMYYTASATGMGWPNGNVINGRDSTPFTPAAVEFKNKLYVIFKANDSGNRIWASGSGNGTSWPNANTINDVDHTPLAPVATVFNDKLYIFFKADDGGNRIYQTSSSDGVTWPSAQIINDVDHTPLSPAADVFDGKLYVYFRADDSGNGMYSTASSDGQSWPGAVRINLIDHTPLAPAACAFNGNPYVFFRADDPSNRIFFTP